MPNFPTTLDTWSDRVDGVHDNLADDVNEAHKRAIAAETKLGVDGATRGAANVEGRLKEQEARLTISTTAPSSPATDDAWLDISGDPVLSVWDGAAWVALVAAAADHSHTATAGDGGVLTADEHDSFSEYAEVATPSAPASGKARLYPKADGLFYGLDDAGVERALGGDVKRVTADVAFAATTTLGTVTGLSVPVTAGETYELEARLFVTADATGGQKYAIGGTATATAIIYDTVIADLADLSAPAAGRATALGTALALAGNTRTVFAVTIRGTLTVNAGGTLLVQAAQDSASGTTSVLRGSTLRVRAVA